MDYKTAVANYTKIPLEEDLRLAGDRCFIHFLTENILINRFEKTGEVCVDIGE